MEAFGTVLIVVCVVAVLVAIASYWGSGKIYQGLGRTGLLAMDDERERRPQPAPQSAAAQAEAREEIRQMLEAKSHRRQARGEPPLDVEAELAALTTSPATPQDEALREEVRQHVVARNERRLRQGKEPLDVEAEVDRQLREFGG
jgi:hypothetical protein